MAALAVVAFHLSLMMGLERYGGVAVFRDFTAHGNLGVDFFFVLSGFIIMYAHSRDIGNPSKWGKYFYRRFVRIFPIYWLYTLGFVTVLFLGFGTDAKMPTTFIDWATALTLIRFTEISPPIGEAWTLFHEIAFYLTFSILILSRRIGIAVILAVLFALVTLYRFTPETERTAFNVYLAAINLEFYFGMAAYWLYKRGGKGVAEFLGGTMIVLAGTLYLQTTQQVPQIALAAGFAFVMTGLIKLEAANLISIPRILSILGDASYSIYLTHVSLLGLFLKILIKVGPPILRGSSGSEPGPVVD